MKSFIHLIEEVQKKGLCHHCGGCVTFCTAINYGALEIDEHGLPRFADQNKCIECGLCYSICPEIDELEQETKKKIGWKPPIGNVLETHIARATDGFTRTKATDGGVVTGLLMHLLERGHIDGAIVARQAGPFNREPCLAVTRDELIDAAGFHFETSHGMKHFSHDYSTFAPSVQEFRPMLQKGLRRVAMVGTPCQIKALRRMEVLGIVPSDVIKYRFGLFCSGNFTFGDAERDKLSELGNFKWSDIKKVNVKQQLMIHLTHGDVKTIDLARLDFMKRYACHFCKDYSAEYADISFGGIGAEEGWTTVITRTPLGRAIFADAINTTLELYKKEDKPRTLLEIMDIIKKASSKKQKSAEEYRSQHV
ncbi:MAG: Coenzyme F420 hydrogenase/dehydrogenase, beta subunit C-terminal domain [Desulfobacterales bacterium]|nr:Coenzyme F420 hydrogenase/dehydrogenase, beta subunit C-terminal domain [Desulfobacterales bacterium]